MSKSTARRQIFVNGPIQGALVWRVALYWLLSLFVQALLIMLLSAGSGADDLFQRTQQFWLHLKLVCASSLLTLPVLMLDIVKLSHRWVGPIYRLKKAMRALALGEAVQPLTFRAGDYWKHLADDFNAVLGRVNYLAESHGESRVSELTMSGLELTRESDTGGILERS
jgi:hypothetical protein